MSSGRSLSLSLSRTGRWQKKEDKPASSRTLVNPRGHAGIIGGVFTISIVSVSMNVIVV